MRARLRVAGPGPGGAGRAVLLAGRAVPRRRATVSGGRNAIVDVGTTGPVENS